MQTDGIAASLRLRSAWEAVDLGFRMVAAWWKPIYRLWAVTVLPFTALVITGLSESPELALLVLWWFKPLYDRVVLPKFLQKPSDNKRPGAGQTLGSCDVTPTGFR